MKKHFHFRIVLTQRFALPCAQCLGMSWPKFRVCSRNRLVQKRSYKYTIQ